MTANEHLDPTDVAFAKDVIETMMAKIDMSGWALSHASDMMDQEDFDRISGEYESTRLSIDEARKKLPALKKLLGNNIGWQFVHLCLGCSALDAMIIVGDGVGVEGD